MYKIIPNTAVFGPTNFIGTIASTTTARGWKRTISTVISFCMQCEVLALAFLLDNKSINSDAEYYKYSASAYIISLIFTKHSYSVTEE